MRRLLLPVTAVLVLSATAACSEGRELATRAQDCTGLAQDVAASGLDRTPSQAEAERAAERLDERINELDDEDLQQAASTLRDRLREVQQAARDADPDAAQRAVEQARDAARDVAQMCGLPVDQVLGQ